MGFLDHSTNNIIIDAVLTDTGRKMLADNRGRFRIAFFSLGDDEVDYTTIEKFGRSVGKEKISKNTPIFEAQTLSSLGLKHRLLTLPDPLVSRMPKLTFTAANLANDILEFTTGQDGAGPTQTLTVQQKIEGQAQLPDGVADTTFTVLVPDRFLYIPQRSDIGIEPTTRIATYSVSRDDTMAEGGGAQAAITFAVRSLDATLFNLYGGSTKTVIESHISVIGDQSGIRKDLTVKITKS